MKRGDTFTHKHWLDSSKMPEKVPLQCRVTRVANGRVYYRPIYGTRDDGTDWLGAPTYFPLADAAKYVAVITPHADRA